MKCHYCGEDAQIVDGTVIYPWRPDLASKRFWYCEPCDAYVGCHPNGKPLGTLANRALREARIAAHSAFDPMWREGNLSRTEAYGWLSAKMAIDQDYCHIARFTEEQCKKVVEICLDNAGDL